MTLGGGQHARGFAIGLAEETVSTGATRRWTAGLPCMAFRSPEKPVETKVRKLRNVMANGAPAAL